MSFVGYFCPQKGENQRQEGIKRCLCWGINVPKIYPICWFGIPQMAKWDIPEGGLGYWDMDNEAEL